MRFKKSIRNIFAGVAQQIIVILLALVNRTLFAKYMGMEYLGYSSLFSNIFMWMSFVDAGFSTAILYRFYQALGQKDEETLSSLTVLSQKVFTRLAFIVLFVGISITGLVPYLIKGGTDLNLSELFGIYWIQLLGTVVVYFSAGRRILFQAMQDDFICSSIDTCLRIFISILQILAVIQQRNIYEYLGIATFGNIVSVLLFKVVQIKRYPTLTKKKRCNISLKGSGILNDMGNFVVHKLSYLIYGATDSTVISIFCGAQKVAQYSNYVLIYQHTSALLFGKIFDALQSSIGNFVHSESAENQKELFDKLNVIGFMLGNIVCCGYVACFQSFVKWWMGSENLLSSAFVALYILTAYVTFNTEVLYKFRVSYGEYAADKYWMVASAVANIAISISLISRFGLAGVQCGTLAGLLLMVFGRAVFVFAKATEIKGTIFFKKLCLRFMLFAVEAMVITALTMTISESIVGIVFKGIVSLIISVTGNLALLKLTGDGKATNQYLYQKIHAWFGKMEEK